MGDAVAITAFYAANIRINFYTSIKKKEKSQKIRDFSKKSVNFAV